MKKGFSVAKAIFILFFVAAFGVGVYYGYNNYVLPMLEPSSEFIPEALQEYARGEDAEIIFIFNDKENHFSNLLGDIDAPEEAQIGLKSALVLVSYSSKCGYSALEFESTEKIEDFRALIKKELMDMEEDVVIEQEDKILIISSIDDDEKCLKGDLNDNQLIKNLDPEYVDHQVVVATNNEELESLMFLLSGSLNTIMGGVPYQSNITTANAQIINPGDVPSNIASAPRETAFTNQAKMITGTLMTSENTTIYSKLDGSEMNLTIKLKIMDKESIEKSYIFDRFSNITTEEFYEEIDKMFNEEVNNKFEEMTKSDPNFKGNSKYEDLIVTLNLNFNIADLVAATLSNVLSKESRARDAVRMSHLNSMVANLELYFSDNGTYPKQSSCFEEDFMEKDVYFAGGKSPVDPLEEQTFGDITCKNGYYYQFINGGYVLWAKMEIESNGNTNLTPTKLEELTSDGIMPEMGESGTYYYVNQLGLLPQPKETSDEDAQEPVKVKRKS